MFLQTIFYLIRNFVLYSLFCILICWKLFIDKKYYNTGFKLFWNDTVYKLSEKLDFIGLLKVADIQNILFSCNYFETKTMYQWSVLKIQIQIQSRNPKSQFFLEGSEARSGFGKNAKKKGSRCGCLYISNLNFNRG